MPAPVEITFRPISKPTIGNNNYQGFKPGESQVYKAGYTGKGWDDIPCKTLTSDILVEHDVELVVRDGAKLYADIYRPANSDEKIPIVISWSPYGKKYNGISMLPVCTWKCGVVPGDLSGLEKFEGLDPAVWCPWGYAIASVDARGSGNSDGNVELLGNQDAEDGHDVVELLAKLPFCNGNVGFAGNSALAISQYFIAATQPPSLKAIAPWEGLGDMYREQFNRGGIYNISNFNLIAKLIIQGHGGVEDFEIMTEKYPLTGPYWDQKRVDMTKIKIPTYLSGSDVSSLHTMGTLRAWLEIDTPHKWLRWSGYQEWFDLWAMPETQHDLKGFFDRFLKEKQNDWVEKTPRVRMTALQFGDKDPIEDIVVEDWPIPSTKYVEAHLCEGGKISLEKPVPESSEVTYDTSESEGGATFKHKFTEKTRIMGLPKAHLFMSCPDHDDMAIFVSLQKLDKDGDLLKHVQVPIERRWIKKFKDMPASDHTGVLVHPGSLGMLKASHRSIDRSRSIHEQFPFHPHDKVEKIPPGEIVELEIGIWHMGADFEAGESLQILVSGNNPNYPELKNYDGKKSENINNLGKHILYMGSNHPSRVILPIVPL
ncbi:hypothetical protein NliqN6_6377 [Naganishia liquefaciens]|uniref:Xaa-Pro dipeptidyl-peptidase C-terminal domain-containing protein n=1 Tax=Naganishia liquefaciens TaxID=104408 RepID=A0A8H3TZB2_9TREE|nr:hypothetical protein NliqN6_6377 [Naganishia liquefaciens]